MSQSASTKTQVAIIPGFTEGDWHTKKLRQRLHQQGFVVINQPLQADIVITHSAGWYEAPAPQFGQLHVHIGPPHWPGRSLTRRMLAKVLIDLRYYHRQGAHGHWVQKTLWSGYYLVRYPRRWTKLYSRYRPEGVVPAPPNTVFIWNHDDTFTHHTQLEPLGGQLHSLPGIHDDIWLNPEPYVTIIQTYQNNFTGEL